MTWKKTILVSHARMHAFSNFLLSIATLKPLFIHHITMPDSYDSNGNGVFLERLLLFTFFFSLIVDLVFFLLSSLSYVTASPSPTNRPDVAIVIPSTRHSLYYDQQARRVVQSCKRPKLLNNPFLECRCFLSV